MMLTAWVFKDAALTMVIRDRDTEAKWAWRKRGKQRGT